MMLLLLSPAKDLLSVSHLWVTEDPATHFISVMIPGFLPRQTWLVMYPRVQERNLTFFRWSQVTGILSCRPESEEVLEALLHPQLRVYVGATLANTK